MVSIDSNFHHIAMLGRRVQFYLKMVATLEAGSKHDYGMCTAK